MAQKQKSKLLEDTFCKVKYFPQVIVQSYVKNA